MENSGILSTNATLTAAREFRKENGRFSVEPGLKEYLKDLSSCFKSLFSLTPMINLDFSLIFCNDVKQFISTICEKRHVDLHDEETVLKVGADSRKKNFKVTLSVVNKKLESSGDAKFQSSGVKKIFVLAGTLDADESFENFSFIWSKLKLNEINGFFFVADLKMVNISCGLTCHASSFPCPFCQWEKGSFRTGYERRTFKQISDYKQQWVYAGAKETDLKHFFNCEWTPVFGPGNDLVLSRVAIPSLHIMLGLVNRIYAELDKSFPKTQDWIKNLGLIKDQLHGGQFNGNSCRKILKKSNGLYDFCALRSERRLVERYYCNAFQALDKVINSCFKNPVQPGFQEHILQFKTAYLELGIPVTSKCHILVKHVEEQINLTGRTLGDLNE